MKIALAFLVIFLATECCLAQQTNRSDEIIIPAIKMDDVWVSDAIKNLAQYAQINYIVDSRVIRTVSDPAFPKVTIAFENITAKEALDRILKIRRLERIENPATTVSRIVPANLGIKPVDPVLLKNDTNGICPKILMEEEVSLLDAIVNLAHQINLKISFNEKLTTVQSTYVSFHWTKLTCKQALIALLDNYDLTMTEDASTGSAKISAKEAPRTR